jgi:DNA end-binding protein Ku
MKSIWNGSLSFGLVNIPVKLYSAIESRNVLSFRLLHKESLSPIRYRKWCDECEKEVEQDEIVKGFEFEKDKYYVIDKEELEQISPKKTDTIEIKEIIDSKHIDPIYVGKHYFVGPSKKDEKAYMLFREVLQSEAKIAIGVFILREKEHICAVEAYKQGLLLSILNYDYEVRNISDVENVESEVKLSKEEIELAKQLVARIYNKDFDITKYTDSFSEELKKLLEKKAKGEVVEIREKAKTIAKEEDLVEALKASLKN